MFIAAWLIIAKTGKKCSNFHPKYNEILWYILMLEYDTTEWMTAANKTDKTHTRLTERSHTHKIICHIIPFI